MKQITSTTKTVIPNRVRRWKAPTGRWLDPGKTFKIKNVPGAKNLPGEYVFMAYVEADPPYVECRRSGKGNIRCIDPARVYEVSNDKAED